MADTRDARIPVDRGWAWMVLLGSFAISTINVGTEKSFGIFFIEFLRQFKGKVFMTAMINTVWNVVFSITSASVLLIGFKRVSIRMSVFLGITLCTLGYGISCFATGLEYLLVSQSILVGMGAAFNIPPIYILIGEYFDKKKGIANAVFVSGNSLGGVIMPPLYRYVFDEYGLRGGLLITAGITFNSLVAAALLRPTTFYINHSSKKLCIDNGDGESKQLSKSADAGSDLNSLQPLLSNTMPNNSTDTRTDIDNKDSDKSSYSVTVKYDKNNDIVFDCSTHKPETMENHVSTMEDEEKEQGCFLKCKNKMDCSLFKNIHFLLFLVIYVLGNVANMCAHIYIPTYAKDIGISDNRIAIIVSVYCISDFAGRIVAGFLADLPRITAEHVVFVSQVVVGLVLQFTIYYTSFILLLVFAVILGCSAGMITALFPPMMFGIVGKARYPSAMAIFILWICLLEGLAVPVLGYFRDVNSTFHFTFHLMGASSFVCISLLIIFIILKKKTSSREKEDINDTSA